MEEFIGFFVRLFCVIGELLIQILDNRFARSIVRSAGMIITKIFWPPNWSGKMEDDGITFYIIGAVFYISVFIYILFYCC